MSLELKLFGRTQLQKGVAMIWYRKIARFGVHWISGTAIVCGLIVDEVRADEKPPQPAATRFSAKEFFPLMDKLRDDAARWLEEGNLPKALETGERLRGLMEELLDESAQLSKDADVVVPLLQHYVVQNLRWLSARYEGSNQWKLAAKHRRRVVELEAAMDRDKPWLRQEGLRAALRVERIAALDEPSVKALEAAFEQWRAADDYRLVTGFRSFTEQAVAGMQDIERALGERDDYSLGAMETTARLFLEMGETEAARKLRRRRVEIALRHQDDDPMAAVRVLLGTVRSLMSMSEREEALPLCRQACTINERLDGKEKMSPQTAATFRLLASFLRDVAKQREATDVMVAQKLFQEALDISIRLDGKGHWQSKQDRQAVDDLTKVAGFTDEQRKLWAESHELAAKIEADRLRADWKAALPRAQRLFRIQDELWGRKHRRTAESLTMIGYIYRNLGDNDKALAPLSLAVKESDASPHEYTGGLLEFAMAQAASKDFKTTGDLMRTLTASWPTMYRSHEEITNGELDAADRVYESLIASDVRAEEFASAHQVCADRLTLLTKCLGARHWRVTDCTWDLTYYRRLADLAPEFRSRLLAANDVSREQAERDLKRGIGSQAAIDAARQRMEVNNTILGPKHPRVAATLIELSNQLFLGGQRRDAEQTLRLAFQIQRESLGDSHPKLAATLKEFGVHSLIDDAALAEKYFRQAHAGLSQVLGRDHPQTIALLSGLADSLSLQGKSELALPLRLMMLSATARQFGSQELNVGLEYASLVHIYIELKDWDRGEAAARKAIELIEKHSGRISRDTILVKQGLATLLVRRGQFEEGERLLRDLLATLRETNGADDEAAIGLLGVLWLCAMEKGDISQMQATAEEILKRSLLAYGEKHQQTLAAKEKLAVTHMNQGRVDVFLRLREEVYDGNVALLGSNHAGTIAALDGLVAAQSMAGDDKAAEQSLRRVIRARQETGANPLTTIHDLEKLAMVRMVQGDYEETEKLLREAVRLSKSHFDRRNQLYFRLMDSLAYILVQTQRVEEAKAILTELEAQLPAGADDDFRRRREQISHTWLCVQLRQGQLDESERLLRERRKRAESRHDLKSLDDHQWTANWLGLVLELRGERVESENLSRNAVEAALETGRRSHAGLSDRLQIAHSSEVHRELGSHLSMLARTGKPIERAYSFVLESKGLFFMRQRAVRVGFDQPVLAARLRDLQSASSALASAFLSGPDAGKEDQWQRRIERLIERREKLEQELMAQSESFRKIQLSPSVEQILAAMPRDVVLIDFYQYQHSTLNRDDLFQGTSEPRLLAFVLRPGQPVECVPLGTIEPLEELLQEWQRSYGVSPAARKAGQELRRLVWQPLQRFVAENSIVLLSPDGILNRLSFAALPGRTADTFLLDEYRLAILPVPQDLPRLLASLTNEVREPTMMFIGDVDYDARSEAPVDPVDNKPAIASIPALATRANYAALAGTGPEVLAIQQLFKQRFADGTAQTLARRDATETAFRQHASKTTWLHLATHGFFAPPEVRSANQIADSHRGPQLLPMGSSQRVAHPGTPPGLLSGLVLAGANQGAVPGQDDGILTASEVEALDLRHVELAVLSACETGLGEVAGGEGVLGLQRAFLLSGCRTTVTSLWKVPDEATRHLMQRFYENLWVKKMSRIDALREAQLWLLKEGKGRGLTRGLEIADKSDQPNAPSGSERPSPFYWAAFVLSGDWR